MIKYEIPYAVAHQIAVGLYRQVGEFAAAAKRDNPDDYERFKAAYLAQQTTHTSAPIKRRCTRKSHTPSR